MSPFHEEQIFRQIEEQKRFTKQSPAVASSRTQHKLQLQRLSFLTNDKNYLDHPKNMKRLTKELDRVNREYRCVRRFEDPVQESFRRLNQKKSCINTAAPTNTTVAATAILSRTNSSSSSNSSSNSSSLSSSAEQPNGFLGRWFAQESTNGSMNSNLNSNNNIDTNAVVYSFHPTIANSMKRRTKY